jgi:NAD dependent epimerase/dehydratase family enzyme
MKIVLPGGTGHLGGLLASFFRERGHQVVVLGRAGGAGVVRWDGKTIGSWAAELEGADAVVNLAGRSVNCRYSAANLREMMDSRVDSTRVVGEAIARAAHPPRVWLQSSTATIYAHRFDAPNTEETGIIGGAEPDRSRS